MFDTIKKGYRFKSREHAYIFATFDLKPFGKAVVRRGLPEYKGQIETGWTVYHKARTIADELEISRFYRNALEAYEPTEMK